MKAAWMVYGIMVSGLVALASWAVARLLGRWGLPVRFSWAAGIVGAAALPAAGAVTGPFRRWASGALGGLLSVRSAPSDEALGIVLLDPLAVPVAPESLLGGLDGLLVVVWALGSALLFVGGIRAHRRLAAVTRAGTPGGLDTLPVTLTRDTGPAVIGVLRGRILLPEWLADGDPRVLEMVLLHEREHLDARDTRLLLLASLVVTLLPWNPVLWWMRGRLREAVEMDCDARVLRRRPGVLRDYSLALLDVGARTRAVGVPAAALTEPASLLERRIRTMTESRPPRSVLRAALLGATAGLALVFACSAPPPSGDPVGVDQDGPTEEAVLPSGQERDDPRPDASEDEAEAATRAGDDAGGPSGPHFTPFTKAPDLVNADEAIEALQSAYPPELKALGIGGTARVWFYIDRSGETLEILIRESSGQEDLDEAALRVARTMEFTPALNRTERVPVWLSLPITFVTE